MAMLPNRNKGTGFTNINRIIDANRGNKLGQTVASGVQNQVQNVNNRLENDVNTFNQKAQENRLDTEENKQQRDNVIGRFGGNNNAAPQSGFAPDMSNFQASSGLQDQFNAAKAKFEQDKLALQGQLPALQKKAAASKKAISDFTKPGGGLWEKYGTNTAGRVGRGSADTRSLERAYQNDLESIKQLQSQLKDDVWNERLSLAQADYDKGLEAERQKYIDDQRRIYEAQFAPTEAEIAQFAKFREGKYEGPQQIENFDSLIADAQNAEILSNFGRTSDGRQELLRRFVGGQGYTKGEKNLDSLLLKDDPATKATLRATRGLTKDVKQAGSAASGLAQELANRANAFGKETVNQLQANLNPLSGQVDQRLTDIQNQELAKQTEYENLVKEIRKGGVNKALSSGLLDSVQAKAINRGKFSNIAPNLIDLTEQRAFKGDVMNLNDLLASNMSLQEAQNVNRAGAATVEQENRINALQRLLGQNAEFANAGLDGDYKASKGVLDFDTANKQLYDAGVNKFNTGMETAKGLAAHNYGSEMNRKDIGTDLKAALDLWKKQSKFFGYDPDNQ